MPTGLRTVLGLLTGGAIGFIGPWVFVFAMAAANGEKANLGGGQGGGLEVCGCSMVSGMGGAALGALLGGLIGGKPSERQRRRGWDDNDLEERRGRTDPDE